MVQIHHLQRPKQPFSSGKALATIDYDRIQNGPTAAGTDLRRTVLWL